MSEVDVRYLFLRILYTGNWEQVQGAGWELGTGNWIGIFVQRNAEFSRTTLMHRRLISIGKAMEKGGRLHLISGLDWLTDGWMDG